MGQCASGSDRSFDSLNVSSNDVVHPHTHTHTLSLSLFKKKKTTTTKSKQKKTVKQIHKQKNPTKPTHANSYSGMVKCKPLRDSSFRASSSTAISLLVAANPTLIRIRAGTHKHTKHTTTYLKPQWPGVCLVLRLGACWQHGRSVRCLREACLRLRGMSCHVPLALSAQACTPSHGFFCCPTFLSSHTSFATQGGTMMENLDTGREKEQQNIPLGQARPRVAGAGRGRGMPTVPPPSAPVFAPSVMAGGRGGPTVAFSAMRADPYQRYAYACLAKAKRGRRQQSSTTDSAPQWTPLRCKSRSTRFRTC